MADKVQLTFHGAAHTVTGSCMELSVGGRRVLVDCGMFQGSRTLEALNRAPFTFDPATLDAVLLTHAHIDHSGLLPKLRNEGFAGPIFCTRATADLLAQMLPDSGRIQESEAEHRNRRTDRLDEAPAVPAYTEADAEATLALVRPIPLDQWFEAAPGIPARLWNAGHILGSASIEVAPRDVRLLFSGDIGPEQKAFHPDADAPAGFDHVICESTYGDRDRPPITIEERRSLLEQEAKAALGRGGNLIIPAFAIERTQELLLDLARLINAGRLPHTPVFIDSPLASRATGVFARHQHELEDLGDGQVFRHPAFHFVESVEQSRRLNDVSGAIIIAASGMCEAGRIRHHLTHNLWRSDSTLLFVGFQAQGTLGRTILDGARRVRISGRDVVVKAAIRRIDSYSAHADRDEILAWIAARRPIRGSLFLSHGEANAVEALRRELQSRDAAAAIVTPEIGERYTLEPGLPATRIATGRVELREAVGRDWQNDYADFAVNLKRQLRRIKDDAARKQALARMRDILDSYAAAGHRGRRT